MNKVLVCLSIFFIGTSLIAQTILSRGDLAILGVNSTISPSTQDEISFVCFQDITKGTEIQLTDNGYEACAPGTWSSAEGGVTFTRTGSTIPAGTVMTLRDAYTNGSSVQFTYPDGNWSTKDLSPNNVTAAYLNLNSKGDQLYFAQNGTWTNIPNSSCTVSSTASGNTTSPNAEFPGVNGRILFGFSTSGGWNSLQNSTGESGLYPSTDCFTMALTSASKFNKYTGLLTAATQTEWLARISNKNNWSGYTTSTGYFAAKPDFHTIKLGINTLGSVSNPAWSSPKNLICSADNIIDLKTLITGTQGGSWSGVGTSSTGLFDPSGLNGTYSLNYSVNYSAGSKICQLSQTDTINVATNITPTFNPISLLQGSAAPELPTNSTNIPPITGTWNTGINTETKGITNYTFTPNNTRCNSITTFGVNVLDTALSPVSICINNSLTITGASDAVSISWFKKGNAIPVKTALQVAPTTGVTVAGNGTKGNSSGQIGYPLGVAVDSKGNVYVSDSTNNQVSKWAPGAKTCTIAAGGNGWGAALNQLKNPIAVFIDSKDNLYVSDYNGSRVLKFPSGSTSATNGVVVAGGNNNGTAANQLKDPTGVYVDSSGNVYVSDAGNYRVVKWEPSAKTGTVVIQGPTYSWFPSGLCGAGNDSLYVTQGKIVYLGLTFGSDGISKFPLNGTETANYKNGNSLGSGSTPAFPFLDKKGNLYMTEHGSNDVLVYKKPSFVRIAGGAIGGNASDKLNNPTGLWVVNGTIYVGDYNNFRVQKWAPIIDTTYTPTSGGNYYAVITRFSGALDTTNTITVSEPTSSVTNSSICQGQSYTFNGITYTSAGTYKANLKNSGGCDSIATLNLTIKNPTSSSTKASICKTGSYTFNGTTYTTVGTYTSTLTNSVGCDSVATLILSIKDTATSTTYDTICAGKSIVFGGSSYSASGTYSVNYNLSGSCDSVANLVLTVRNASASTTKASICTGGSYTFNGTTYTTAGTYKSTLTNSVGCDSVATLELTVKQTSTSTTATSICIGGSYTFNGTVYTTAGTYTAHLTNSVGCDSVATLILTVNPTSTSNTTINICAGGSHTFNGTTYTTAGTYTMHLTNSVGCDSVATLILSVKPTSSSITSAKIKQGESYLFNGISYTTSGTYTAHLTNSVGCDSAATLVLTVNNPTSASVSASICLGSVYLFNGTSYSSSGTYIIHLTNTAGGDSVVTLNLTINKPSTSITNASICPGSSYTFNGSTYSTAGTYTATLSNSVGCDSTAILVLTMKTASNSTTKASVCPGSSYTFNGSTFSSAGTYTIHLSNSTGCDSAATLVLTIKTTSTSTTKASICTGGSYTFNGTTYTNAGTYTAHLTNSVGCDSIATLVLSINPILTSNSFASICAGGSYTFNGSTYSTVGIYTAHLMTNASCDSVATLVLTVKPTLTSTTTASICAGDSYTFNGSSYTNTGTYTVHLTTNANCDSIATLVLSVKPTSSSTTTANIKQGGSYLFNGTSYSIAGTYTAHLINSVGCDSVATLVLTVNKPTNSTVMANICLGNSYLFNGTNYTSTGTYTAHLTNAAGGDSIATLVLIVNKPSTSITKASICAGGSYTFNGSTYSTSGTYTTHLKNSMGCDSAATLVLNVKATSSSLTAASICLGNSYTFNGSNYSTAGKYTVHLTNSVGCDSAATLALTVDDPTKYPPEGPTAVCKGATIQLTDLTKGGVWSSLSPTIATIDSLSGVVTGISTGIAKINYTVNASCGQIIDTGSVTVLGVKPTNEIVAIKPATCLNPQSGAFTITISGKENPYVFEYNGKKFNSNSYVTNLGVGAYDVAIYNNDDCLVDSMTNINVSRTSDASCDTVYVPTGFVPTGSYANGHNPILKPYGGLNSVKSVLFRVFNRGGYLIFESHDLISGWDGTINGQLQNGGTYIWSLEFTSKDGKRHYANGTSVLLR